MTDNHSETGVIRLNKVDDFVEYSTELIQPAVRQISILTSDMERNWLGQEAIVEQLKQSIIKNRRMQVRLLAADPTLAIKQNHPLIPLIRRLSRFEARAIEEEILEKQPLRSTMILVDRGGVIVRQSADDFVGFCHFNDEHTVKNLSEDFNQYWRYSYTHSDLRHIVI